MRLHGLPLLSLLLSATAAPQPDASAAELVPRQNGIPDCSHNGGTAYCCQGTFAGDLPLIKTLAGLTQFPLNPNDVNCIGVSNASASCVGVNTCCQVRSVLNAGLLALYCQKPANC